MKIKALIALVTIGIFGFIIGGKSLSADTVNIYLFWGEGCPHCAKEKEFLIKIAKKDPSISVYGFEVYNDMVARSKLIEVSKKLGVEVNGVPFLVIGDKYLVGYMSDATTGKDIERLIEENRKNGCYDIFSGDVTVRSFLLSSSSTGNSGDGGSNSSPEECTPTDDSDNVILPKIGNINLEKLSLPALTVVLRFLDGFNPCAMWVLLFLISLLLGMENKKKMWVLGITFIVTSAFVYFLFMVAWLNLFHFIGLVTWVRSVIAVVAFAGAYASLKKYFSKDPTGCDVNDSEKKKKIFDKLGRITSNKSFLLALFGIMGMAFAVNLVELVCSAGLPAVYTQVLSLNKLSGVGYYMYILLYILFFMLDDLFVFFVAMTTLHMTGITTKYVKYTRLIGGLLMILIGFLLLFKPELLMFG